MKKLTNYRLPITGTFTSDADEYCKAYHNLAKPFGRLGYVLSSFSPGIRLRTKDFSGVSFSLVSFKSNVQRHLCH